MAGIIGQITNDRNFPEINPALTNDNNSFGQIIYNPSIFDVELKQKQVFKNFVRISEANSLPVNVQKAASFFDDYYYRIHTDPSYIDLQTVASSQSRQIVVWNAHPDKNANLEEFVISDPLGITIQGQSVPFVMKPLKELIYNVAIDANGSPEINVSLLFDFSNVSDPLPVLIVGTRAVKFDIVPEVPINETWQWLSEIMVAVDGTEQRIALRGEMPRVELDIKAVFDSSEAIRNFYSTLISVKGRLWIPEYQYATRTTQESLVGTSQLYYNNENTDLRVGDYALLQTSENSYLIEIANLNANGALSASPLSVSIPQGSLVMPGSAALIENQSSINRYSVNNVAETNLTCKLIRQRQSLIRTGSTSTLPEFLGLPIVDKRPLADELVKDEVSTGQISTDNQTGLQSLLSFWDYNRIGGTRAFKVNRIKNPEEMDYWKAVLAYSRGQVRKFWMPTYRNDLEIYSTPVDAANSYVIKGTDYLEKVWPIPTHRYIEIETAAGIHRAEITGVVLSGSNTTIALNPSVPVGELWREVLRISYLLPVRLSDDKVQWKHYGLESILNFSIRTAEF